MSKSRSPSPSHNRLSLNIVQSPTPSTTSRPQILERPVLEYREPVTVRLSPPPLGSQPAESSSRHRSTDRKRPAEASSEDTMAKRIRRISPERRLGQGNYSEHSSDSQDEMVDSEMETQKVQRPEPTPSSAPPKKKRTRTLTTPHQSAVLHALLAQSRFPTTAMREEVGRSIGLSARKVQIWFQNQRQKARRPRSQSDTPSARLPQYGPFPSATESALHSSREFEEHGGDRMSYRGQPSSDVRTGPLEMPVRLLGPGMPGAPIYPQTTYQQVRPIPVSAPPTEKSFQPGHHYQRVSSPPSYTSPRLYSLPGERPATSQPVSWRERDPARTLPPLVSTRPASSTYGGRRNYPMGEPSYPLSRPAFTAPRSISPEPRFAHLPPEPISRSSINLPPPFTLQPSPQWDDSAFTTFPRPSSSAWSRPDSRSNRGRSTSPVIIRRDHLGVSESTDSHYRTEYMTPLPHSSPRSMPSTSTPPSRPSRYDPVRATFVPYTTPSPAVSPARTGGGGADERTDKNASPVHEDH